MLDATTSPQEVRTIGELVTKPLQPGLTERLTGFENHRGGTVLGPAASPLGPCHWGHRRAQGYGSAFHSVYNRGGPWSGSCQTRVAHSAWLVTIGQSLRGSRLLLRVCFSTESRIAP